MEQALVAAGLDFRCLTFDVHPESLQDAVAGMRAMGFLGAIFADPHQVKIAQHLDEVEAVAQQAGYVDFVMRIDDKLCGQSTLAAAIAELLTKLERMPKSAIILGASAREQLIAAQLASSGIDTTLVDTSAAGNTESDDQLSATEQGTNQTEGGVLSILAAAESDVLAGANADVGHPPASQGNEPLSAPRAAGCSRPSRETTSCHVMTQAEYETQSPPAELVIAASDAFDPDLLQTALRAAATVAMDLTEEPVYTDFLRQAKAAGCTVFNSVDIRLTSLVIAFRQWTHTEPDDSIMRDALEEFLLV